jgi:hypothetical protein
MTLEQLAEIIDRMRNRSTWDMYKDLTVAVVTDEPSAGPLPVSVVVNAHSGSDWDSNRFLIWCEHKLAKTDTRYKF